MLSVSCCQLWAVAPLAFNKHQARLEESPCPVWNATSALGNPPPHKIFPLFPQEFLQSLSLIPAAAFSSSILDTQRILKILCHSHLPHFDSSFLIYVKYDLSSFACSPPSHLKQLLQLNPGFATSKCSSFFTYSPRLPLLSSFFE